jgi:hypothetical protein
MVEERSRAIQAQEELPIGAGAMQCADDLFQAERLREPTQASLPDVSDERMA